MTHKVTVLIKDLEWSDLYKTDLWRTFHMGLCAIPLGFWYSNWFATLGRMSKSAITIAIVDTLILPLIHAIFLIPYHIIHDKKVLNHNFSHQELWDEVIKLWTVDWIIYFPLQLLNFSLVKSNVWRIVNVNLIDSIIDVFASLIINDGFDLVAEIKKKFR